MRLYEKVAAAGGVAHPAVPIGDLESPVNGEAPYFWRRQSKPRLAVRPPAGQLERAGEAGKPNVVYLQGLASDMEGTKAVFTDYLARRAGRTCLRQDYRCVGASEGEYLNGTLGGWYADARDCFDAFTTGRQVLVGSSMGGWFSLLLGLQRPERVAGALLLAPSLDFHLSLRAGMTDQHKRDLEQQGYYERFPGLPVSGKLLDEDHGLSLLDGSKIPVPFPVRVIWGAQDEAVPWERTQSIVEAIDSPDLRLTKLEDAAHRLSRPQDLLSIASDLEELLDTCI